VTSRRKSVQPACIICGTRAGIEQNHVGGQNHVAWFTMPFCKTDHDKFHEVLRNIGVDLRHTPNKLERLSRASQAIIVCLWLIEKARMEAVLRKINP
jgi:hypothetical protein